AGMVEVFALQVDASTAGFLGQAFGEIERRRPADVVPQIILEPLLKLVVLPRVLVMLRELTQREHQRLGNVTAPVGTESALHIGNGGRHRMPRSVQKTQPEL